MRGEIQAFHIRIFSHSRFSAIISITENRPSLEAQRKTALRPWTCDGPHIAATLTNDRFLRSPRMLRCIAASRLIALRHDRRQCANHGLLTGGQSTARWSTRAGRTPQQCSRQSDKLSKAAAEACRFASRAAASFFAASLTSVMRFS